MKALQSPALRICCRAIILSIQVKIGHTAASVFIPQFKVKISKRISDPIFVFELTAICLAIQCLEELQPFL